ncbi:hypothetical protein DV515_00018169 [Chloebia gouldiae]|uniref:PHD-type domain-containing protein n=1 Tax=Chloebia gouldiae TaxID=44316 RepID=A0A3L8Q8A3_CHLGU|nr:hypothetical protein DV515_00018169 [Chloebia gouldiae]
MGLLGFFQRCCVCGLRGAAIMCSKEGCDRWFHLPCAKEGGCVNIYFTPYSSFCPVHRPKQDVEATPEPGTDCPICMEPVEDRKTFRTLVCPTCKRAWFHRDCIQGHAMSTGALFFQCPLCRNQKAFTVEMFIMGIRIPFRLVSYAWLTGQEVQGLCCSRSRPSSPGPALSRESGLQLHTRLGKALEEELGQPVPPSKEGSRNSLAFPFSIRLPTWEENDAYADLGERHSRCDARDCLYPGGREEAEEDGPWELLLCSSCAAEGTHRRCSGLENCIGSWECDSCAGPGRAFRDKPELSGPSLTRQSGLEPAHSSSESEAISSSSSALEPSGLGPKSSPAETRSHSSRQRTAQQQFLPSSSLDTSSPSTTRPANSSIPETENRGHSRHGGPGRGRTRYCQQGRAPNGPVRSRNRCDRRSRTTPRTERPRRRETPSRVSPRRSQSRQQGRALSPPVRSRSRRDSRHRTATRTERPRQRETSSGTSPRRSSSRLQRRGSNQPRPSRSRQDRSRRRAASAERPRHMGTPSGRSHRSNGSSQRRRASTGTSNSST